MLIRIFLLLISITALTAGCNSERGVILDVSSVVNKTPEEVIRILGTPDTTYTERILGKTIFCQRYVAHNIEIQYPESLSTDIVIYGPHGLPFTQSALKAFNIRQQHPAQYERDAVMRWYDLDKFAAVSFYNVVKGSDGGIDNFTIYFKAKFLTAGL